MTIPWLNNLPIKRKLTVITMITTALALALAGAAMAIVDQVLLRRSLVAELSATARLIGFNSASALSFSDPSSAEQTLKSLAAEPHIMAARIYAPDGAEFASYARAGVHHVLPSKAPVEQTVFANDGVEVVRPIDFAGEPIGEIYLLSDLSGLHERLVRSVIAFVVVMLTIGILAYFVSSRLQRVISEPVSQLAAVAARVANETDYSVRAVKHGDDEVGALIDGFNAMLAQIQSRDAALQQAHGELERRVEERTRELVLEIAERRKTEEERDGFFKLSADLMCIAGKDGLVRRANPAFASVLGYSSDEMRGVRFMELVHPEDLRETARKVKRVTAGRPVHNFENRVRHRDGTHRWIAWSVTPAPGQEYFYACGRDVTALKEAQERVAREKARLQLIFESVPVGISLRLIQPDGSVKRLLNDAHLRICGLSREESKHPGVFRRISHPEDFARQLELNRQMEAGESNGYTLEKRYLHADGKVVWVFFSRERHRFADGSFEELSTVVDITELKRAQEQVAQERARFKFIFDSVPIGISWFVPFEEGSHLVNPAHERITGVSAEDARLPGAFARVSHPEDYRRQQELVQKFISGEIDHYSIEKRYLHPDGKVIWAVLSSRMFVESASGTKQSVTTLVDITERKEAEARLAETHRQLIETSRAAGMAEVATGVLHNVGNVLNSVNVSATLLTDLVRESEVRKLGKLSDLLAAQGPNLANFFAADPRAAKVPIFIATLAEHLQREQRDYQAELESLRKNIEHIKDIVAMQQSYARVSGVCEKVTVGELVEDALRMNAGALARHGITPVRDFQANPTLLIDKHKVLQILVNLMRNAKYACEESGRAEKRMTVRIVEESARVKIAVVDNGVGIPAENLTRIFAHGFTTRKHGHGFGLHSGALAAKELGGALIAQSEGPGCGASFVLELPLNAEAEAA